MELSQSYDPSKVEDRWYQHWHNKGFLNFVSDRRLPNKGMPGLKAQKLFSLKNLFLFYQIYK